MGLGSLEDRGGLAQTRTYHSGCQGCQDITFSVHDYPDQRIHNADIYRKKMKNNIKNV